MKKAKTNSITAIAANAARIQAQILAVRGQRVLLDRDLAILYGVTTKRLNEQVTRNADRFPEDFMFRLTLTEAEDLADSRSQIATLKRGHNVKHAPRVFTEHGAIMLASVLNSTAAVHASVFVVRAFVQMRALVVEHAKLAKRIDVLERKYDRRFKEVFDAFRSLIGQSSGKRPIGFIGPESP